MVARDRIELSTLRFQSSVLNRGCPYRVSDMERPGKIQSADRPSDNDDDSL